MHTPLHHPMSTPSKVFSGIVLASVLSLSAASLAHAATSATNGQAILLATVNIQNAHITSQQGHTLALDFDFTNRQGLQPQVHYSLQLVGTTAGNQYVADQYVYPDNVPLAENTTVHKTITYAAPASLSGTFDVYLQSETDTGFPLAIDRVGSVTLQAATTGVELQTNTCYLQIPGEKDSPQYSLLQGIDIKPTESLTLTCKVANHTATALTLTPTYETHYRSPYGDVTAASGGDTTPLTLAAGETKTITLTLPKAATPQSYDVFVSLTGTNRVDAHYVIQGPSATIQTLTLDQDQYATGANAKVSFLWSPAADTFPGSRANAAAAQSSSATKLQVTLQSGSDTCATPITAPLPQDMQVQLALSVTRTCTNPHVTVALLAADGTVLATEQLTRTTPTHFPLPIFLTVLAIICVLAALVVYLKRREHRKHHA